MIKLYNVLMMANNIGNVVLMLKCKILNKHQGRLNLVSPLKENDENV